MAKKTMPVEKLKATKAKPVPVKIVSEGPSTKSDADYEARERRYRAEDALRTMKEMKKIEADKSLMRDAKALAKEEMKKLKGLC